METEKVVQFASIDEIDAALAKEFTEEMKETTPPAEVIPTPEATPAPTQPTDAKTEEEPAQTDGNDAEQKGVTSDSSGKDKKGNAFAELRVKAKEAEDARIAAEKKLADADELMLRLAKSSGFDSVDEYREAVRVKLRETEAKAKGIDPKALKEIEDRDARIKALEADAAQRTQQGNLVKFVQTIDKVVTDFGLDKSEGNKLIAKFEADGYTLEQLLAVPHYEYLIKGALSDVIKTQQEVVANRQARVDKVDTSSIPNSPIPPKSLDDIIDEEMKVYAAERNLRYK